MQHISPSPLPWLLDFMQRIYSDTLPTLAAQLVAKIREHPSVLDASIWLSDLGGKVYVLAASKESDADLDAQVAQVVARGQAQSLATQGSYTALLPLCAGEQSFGALVIVSTDASADEMLWPAVAAHSAVLLRFARAEAPTGEGANEWEEFISHAIHEIKNPLASAKGYADLLLRRATKESNDGYRKGLLVISQQTVKATGLLDQMSDTSRIATNRLNIQRNPADLAEVVRRVVQSQQLKTEQHSIQAEGADLPLPGVFDEARIGQVIEAMITNAVRFSLNGGAIKVRLNRDESENGTPTATIVVSDQGIGVPSGEQALVFGRFKRGSNVQGMYSGLGLGLFIANDLATRHGGRMWLESLPEQGTACFFQMPLA